MESMIRDIKLAPSGHDKIEWVKNFMPVMPSVNEAMEAEGEPVEEFED